MCSCVNALHYNHAQDLHSRSGALAGMGKFLAERSIASLLDVGAGTGTWLGAALEYGVTDVVGIDGVSVDESRLFVPREAILIHDLRMPFRLERRFDAAICLEVAEHLPESSAETLIKSICAHTDFVFFSAAAPGQQGESHINCAPPGYWQEKFNACGFACSDQLRAKIWSENDIEPWYRQNLFVAHHDPCVAGREPRIPHAIHPDMIRYMDFPESPSERRLAQTKARLTEIEAGLAGSRYYIARLRKSAGIKLRTLGMRTPNR
jgi:SAM-dependent methyltransferase